MALETHAKFKALALYGIITLLPTTDARADWQGDVGYTRLKLLVEVDLTPFPTSGIAQIEAPEASGSYAPDTSNSLFTGKTFALKSGTSGTSGHAHQVAIPYYGSASILPGSGAVDCYNANSWISTGYLQPAFSGAPLQETRAVQNHSWIVDVGGISASQAASANQRLDFAINRDGFVCAVGVNNGNTTTLPYLLGQSYHTISVGLTSGSHSAGYTTIDGTGRIKPDIVAPGTATSFATPMVAGAGGLLHAELSASPWSLTGANLPRVIKSLLLASATRSKFPQWGNTTDRPLDERYGAGELNIHHAYTTLMSGRVSPSPSTSSPARGWAAETIAGNSTATYFFTIPAGSAVPFGAALNWHRSITSSLPLNTWGNPTISLADLNLRLYQANGFTVGTLVSASTSTVDNVELVAQSALPPGTYALTVENTSNTATAYALAWHSLPSVTVSATVADANESDGQQGVVTITRAGGTELPLLVPLEISGTAVSGSHFQPLLASVLIPAGSTSATLQIIPVSDDIAQGDRSVVVKIGADFSLVRDTTQSAAITIRDKPFDQWRFDRFTTAELADDAISGEAADPDSDGLPNLIEYALGLQPKSPGITTVSEEITDGYLTVEVAKNPTATDIDWAAETSSDLILWDPAETTMDTAEQFSAKDTLLPENGEPRFIRLRIVRP